MIFAYDSITLPGPSVAARSYALADKGFAERLVASGRARCETEQERQIAIDNRHQGFVGGAPKAKAGKADDGDGAEKPAKPAKSAKPGKAGKADGKPG